MQSCIACDVESYLCKSPILVALGLYTCHFVQFNGYATKIIFKILVQYFSKDLILDDKSLRKGKERKNDSCATKVKDAYNFMFVPV
jgi:hypothetical protein